MSVSYTAMLAQTIRSTNDWYVEKVQGDMIAKSVASCQILSWLTCVKRQQNGDGGGFGGSAALPLEVRKIVIAYMGSCLFVDPSCPLKAVTAKSLAIVERERLHAVLELEREQCEAAVLQIYTDVVTPQIMNHINKGKLEGSVTVSPLHTMPLRQFSRDAREHKSELDLIIQRVKQQGFSIESIDSNKSKFGIRWT
eukprot:GEMP01091399.1.p1 GENE.GEMP01091399.1~~GEMP01091399.1.p1  ORF type:complete len:196 (+),score=31.75 GEMP01091399.1:243-830(+)